jgi:formylglycine-generating enzyme required for sulfatase activity
LGLDLKNPVIRASLAPVVMRLEEQGLSPATVSAADLASAVAQARVMVSGESQALLASVASMDARKEDLPSVVAKLEMLQGSLGVYLPLETRNSVRLAQEKVHAQLTAVQRKKVDALLRRIADGLESRSAVEALTSKAAVRAAEVAPNSFARRHSRLAKPEVQSWGRRFLTLWEERESAGLPPFKNIVIDVRGSRGGRGDVAAGFLVAKDMLARADRARDGSAVGLHITFIMDEKSQPILGGLRGQAVAPGQTEFEGRLSYHDLESLPDSFPAADLYLALARPNGDSFRHSDLWYAGEAGQLAQDGIPITKNTVILVQPVLGNTEASPLASKFARVYVESYKLNALPAGLGPYESGVYSDQVAWKLRGQPRAKVRKFLLDSLPLVKNERDREVLQGILEGQLLASSEPGLVYGISAFLQQKHFERYLIGLARKAQDSGKSYTLISPLAFSKEIIADAALRQQIEVIAAKQVPALAQAEPGKIYIVLTEGLPHPVFVGLMAYARPPPVVAGDGAMSAGIILGRPFVMTAVPWNHKNIANFRAQLLAEESRPEVRLLLSEIYSTPVPNLIRAQELEAYAPLYAGLVHSLPGLTSSILSAAQAAASLLDDMLPISLLAANVADLVLRLDLLLQRSARGEARALDMFAHEYLQAPTERRKNMLMQAEYSIDSQILVTPDGKAKLVLPPEFHGTAAEAMDERKVGIAGRFVAISPGEFEMGAPAEGPYSGRHTGIQHAVKLTQGYELQATPVTQRQYKLVMDKNPSHFKVRAHSDGDYMRVNEELMNGDHPVEMVSWEDVQGFIARLNASQTEYTYRLPTEAEWEYGAGAGTKDPYWLETGEPTDHVWFADNSGGRTHAVGASGHANAWGLYDMPGNVQEWVQDIYAPDSKISQVDPQGPDSGDQRVVRGRSLRDQRPSPSCIAERDHSYPRNDIWDLGFRLARTRR